MTKNVPDGAGGYTPIPFQYFFVEKEAGSAGRTMLGGHWWEGKPFQAGPYSTAMTPAPAWQNGQPPAHATWPCAAGCHACRTLAGATVTRIWMHAVSNEFGYVTDRDMTEWFVQPDGETGAANPTFLNALWTINVDGEPTCPARIWCAFRPLPGTSAVLIQEIPAPGPNYLGTWHNPNTAWYHPGQPNLLYDSDVKFRFFGTQP